MTNTQKIIDCPICGEKNTWHKDNIYRPFCSERCKLIDLGEWASDKHRIPGEPIPSEKPTSEDNENS